MTSDQDTTGPSETTVVNVPKGRGSRRANRADNNPDRGSAAPYMRDLVFTTLAISVLSLFMALTAPLWGPRGYGTPVSGQFMVLRVAQLRPALLSNEPFRNELTLVREVMPSQPDVDQALDMLAAYADKGVPTVPELQASFVKLANAIVLDDVVGTAKSRFDRAIVSVAAAL